MKEIKFRVFDNIEKRFLDFYSDGFILLTCDGDLMIASDRVSCENFCDINRYKTMQYVGLKDKNGKEIYEGDILSGDGIKNYVVENRMYFVSDIYGWEINYSYDDHVIIGNIHENPELLERKN